MSPPFLLSLIKLLTRYDSLHINVVSKGLGNERMVHYIYEAANDMRAMLEPDLESEKAKL